MRRQADPTSRSGTRTAGLVVAAAATALLVTGCGSEVVQRGWLPEPATDIGDRVIGFWNWTWIAALAVGVLVWGLTLWCMVAYRKRKGDEELPVQFRYNVPLEILYTVVPVLMVAVLFGQTVKLQNDMLDTEQEADVIVNVVGKKWSWDFNYIHEDVYIGGVQAINLSRGEPGLREELPTLVLPVDARIEFVLTSRDVIHSWWVPAFLQKLDMLPGMVNVFQVTTTTEGRFDGKCAELCGAYHSQMLFNVEVVSQAEYEQFIEDLRASGNTGQLGNELNLYDFHHGYEDRVPLSEETN